jgi:hypothetical protein
MVDIECFEKGRLLSGYFNDSNTSLNPCIILLDHDLQADTLISYGGQLEPLSVFSSVKKVGAFYFASIAANFFNSQSAFAVLDSNFQLMDSTSIYDPGFETALPNSGYIIPRMQNSTLCIGSAVTYQNTPPVGGYHWSMGVGFIDSNFQFSRIDTFRFSGHDARLPSGYINPKPNLNALAYVTTDSLLLAMTGQEFLKGMGAIDRTANDVYIYNYNADLERLNWYRTYNNGYCQSSLTPVEALPNNRYLVILNEYNWDKYPYDNLSIHLMILNGNGDLINNPELPTHRQALRVFPNPCQERVWVENLEPAPKGSYSYELVDMSGALVETGDILSTGEIHFRQQFGGMHLLRILKRDELVQSMLLKGR